MKQIKIILFHLEQEEIIKQILTEFYNLIYEYKNDCLVASINYNKEYYSNNALEPTENLFFNITLNSIRFNKY